MKVVSKVDGVFRGLFALVVVGACTPVVTVSRDEDPGAGAGGEGAEATGGTTSQGGSAGSGATAGSGSPTGGVGGDAGSGMLPAGSGGDGGSVAPPEGCPCSRRAGAPVSRECPRGAGVSAQTTLDMAGGDAQLSGTTATLGVPFRIRVFAGSLEEETELTLSELTLSPPMNLVDVSPVYRVEPDGLDFVNGGEVSIPWTVPSGSVPPGIAIYHSESPEGPFERIDDSYQNAGFSQATLTRSGYFLAAYPWPQEPFGCP